MASQIKIIPTSIQVPVDREKYRRSSSFSTKKNEFDDVPTKVNSHIDDDDISSLGAPSTIHAVPRRQTKKRAPSSQRNQRQLRNESDDDDRDMMQRALEAEMVNIKLAKMLRESKKAVESASSQVRSLEKKNQILTVQIEEKVEEVRLLEQQLDDEQVRRMSASGVEASLRIRIAELEAENLRLHPEKLARKANRKKTLPTAVAGSEGSTGSAATEKTVSVRTTDSSEEDQKNDITTHRRSSSRLEHCASESSLNGSAGTLGSIFEDEDTCETVGINKALETLQQLEVEDDKGQACNSHQVDFFSSRRGSADDILSRSFLKQADLSGKRPSFSKRSSLPMVEMNPRSLEKNNGKTSRRVSFSSTKAAHVIPAESVDKRSSSLTLQQDLMQNSAPGGLDYAAFS